MYLGKTYFHSVLISFFTFKHGNYVLVTKNVKWAYAFDYLVIELLLISNQSYRQAKIFNLSGAEYVSLLRHFYYWNMKDTKERSLMELDPQVMVHDLKSLYKCNLQDCLSFTLREPHSMEYTGRNSNACWIIKCIPKFAMDFFHSFFYFSLLILKIMIIHTYIHEYIYSFIFI